MSEEKSRPWNGESNSVEKNNGLFQGANYNESRTQISDELVSEEEPQHMVRMRKIE